jgi:hypothetical protein
MRACARAELESQNTLEELEAAGAIFEEACISRVFLVSVGGVRFQCELRAPFSFIGGPQAGHSRAGKLHFPIFPSSPAQRTSPFLLPPSRPCPINWPSRCSTL